MRDQSREMNGSRKLGPKAPSKSTSNMITTESGVGVWPRPQRTLASVLNSTLREDVPHTLEHEPRSPGGHRSPLATVWKSGLLATLNVVFALCLVSASLDAGPGWSGTVDRDSGDDFGGDDTGGSAGSGDSGFWDGDSGYVIDQNEYFETRTDTDWNGWCVQKNNNRGYSCTEGQEWAEITEAEVAARFHSVVKSLGRPRATPPGVKVTKNTVWMGGQSRCYEGPTWARRGARRRAHRHPAFPEPALQRRLMARAAAPDASCAGVAGRVLDVSYPPPQRANPQKSTLLHRPQDQKPPRAWPDTEHSRTVANPASGNQLRPTPYGGLRADRPGDTNTRSVAGGSTTVRSCFVSPHFGHAESLRPSTRQNSGLQDRQRDRPRPGFELGFDRRRRGVRRVRERQRWKRPKGRA